MAYNIARLYLWTGPRYQPIPDKEPKITDRVRGIVDRFDHGKLSAADFTPLMWSELSPWRKQAEQDAKTLGPALSLALVERTTEAGRQSYRYRISYKSQTNLLHVAIDEQNKIAIWKVEDVDIN